ncbi:hypothetical protein CBR_g4049 [Chara braunii]|uniref:Reverse transcriptase domain-containing protein n=1 Tax=Chara braunii TaxID=69332 RepID=A0A388KH17_CHABU|nr:hypothetical protein CBR_g4049 [Chara braunii]|eukprot:GBG69355.1 hypothetical protein CBR_g4049 [Chara braunii]
MSTVQPFLVSELVLANLNKIALKDAVQYQYLSVVGSRQGGLSMFVVLTKFVGGTIHDLRLYVKMGKETHEHFDSVWIPATKHLEVKEKELDESGTKLIRSFGPKLYIDYPKPTIPLLLTDETVKGEASDVKPQIPLDPLEAELQTQEEKLHQQALAVESLKVELKKKEEATQKEARRKLLIADVEKIRTSGSSSQNNKGMAEFISGAMRIGEDAVIVTQTETSRSVGFLSMSYNVGREEFELPIVTYCKIAGSMVYDERVNSKVDAKAAISALKEYSPFDKYKLGAAFEKIKHTGTCIFIYNLMQLGKGYELEWDEPDPAHASRSDYRPDIRISTRAVQQRPGQLSTEISIQPNDRYKSAFKTRYGHFESMVMPFGLTNTPTTFQAAMTNEFRAMLDWFVLVYLDNILVYSQILEDHFEHLRRVLETLRHAKYKANRDKCEFVRQELEYLGHLVTPEGISSLSDKIQGIQEWPEPRNITDVRSFLGLAGYYQRFIKGCSKIATHLTKLQCEDWPFDFEEDALSRRFWRTLSCRVMTRGGIVTTPCTKEQEAEASKILAEHKARKEAEEFEKTAKKVALLAKKVMKEELEEELKRLQKEKEEVAALVDEEEDVEITLQRNVKTKERGECRGAQERDAKMERMVSEWVANLALGEEEEAMLLVPQTEREEADRKLREEADP